MNKTVRILHDGSFIHPGGSARVAKELAKAFDAPVTVGHSADTSFWNDVDVEFAFQETFHSGGSGFAYNHIPKHYAELLVGQKFRSLDFTEDVLISTSVHSKWIVPKYYQQHINYCHVPPVHFYGRPKQTVFDWIKATSMAIVDRHFTDFCDGIFANSEFTRKRVDRHYRRDAPVLHPPVRVEEFSIRDPDPEPYFVMIARLVPMKRAELVARAFANRTDVSLKIVGNGPLKEACESYPSVTTYQGLTDEAVEEIVEASIGGIAFAEKEHCGLTPKEFQAAGKPVIVPDEPNLCNHVIDNETGVIVPISVDGVNQGISRILQQEWDPNEIRAAAESWGRDAFRENARRLVEGIVADS